MNIIINRGLLIERRDALGLSQRALAKALGVIPHVIYALEGSERSDSNLTLGFLSRLADVLGVAATALQVSPAADATDTDAAPPMPDTARLLAALIDEATVTLSHRDDLARTFDWPIERVAAAVSDAGDALPALGLRLHAHPADGYAIRSADGVLAGDEQQRLARARTRRATINITAARLLRNTALGRSDPTWRRTRKQTEQVPMLALLKRGLVTDTPAGLALTQTTAYSLLLSDTPPR